MINERVTLEDLLILRPQLKAFLFDLDGTLVNSQEGIITTIHEFLQTKGHTFDRELITEMFGKPLEVVFKLLIPDLTEEDIAVYLKEIRERYSKNHTEITPLFPKTKEILDSIKARGFKTGVASTKFKRFIVEILEHYNLLGLFDVIVSGYEVENHKPAPDILIEAAKQLQVLPSECVYIGDSPSDIEAGKRAGCISIAVLTGPHDQETFVNEKPDYLIENLLALILDKS